MLYVTPVIICYFTSTNGNASLNITQTTTIHRLLWIAFDPVTIKWIQRNFIVFGLPLLYFVDFLPVVEGTVVAVAGRVAVVCSIVEVGKVVGSCEIGVVDIGKVVGVCSVVDNGKAVVGFPQTEYKRINIIVYIRIWRF